MPRHPDCQVHNPVAVEIARRQAKPKILVALRRAHQAGLRQQLVVRFHQPHFVHAIMRAVQNLHLTRICRAVDRLVRRPNRQIGHAVVIEIAGHHAEQAAAFQQFKARLKAAAAPMRARESRPFLPLDFEPENKVRNAFHEDTRVSPSCNSK